MSDVMEDPVDSVTANINELCDDVLLEIFSYLNTQHLVHNVFEVCSRWMSLVKHDYGLWKNRWYMWDVSLPFEDFIKVMDRIPNLKSLTLASKSTDVNINAAISNVLSNIPHIKNIDLLLSVSSDIIQYLNPNIVALSAINISHQDYDLLTSFKSIEILQLRGSFDFCGRHLRNIADNCPKLKKLHLASSRGISDSDVMYFLQRKCEQIEGLELNGFGLTDQSFLLMAQCMKLQELRLSDTRLMEMAALIEILNLPKLQVLQLLRLKYFPVTFWVTFHSKLPPHVMVEIDYIPSSVPR